MSVFSVFGFFLSEQREIKDLADFGHGNAAFDPSLV
jgi:hypothetical protein